MFGRMIRIISHILQKTGFLAIFIELSYVCACSVTVYSCKRAPNGPIEQAIPLVTLLLVLQNGAYLRGEITSRAMRWRWLVATIFFLGAPRLLCFYDVNWNVVDQAFSAPIRWDYILEGVGSFYHYVALFWMPFAGLISFAAWVATFAPRDEEEEFTEENVPPKT
jgi:hypothetical protein